LTDFYDGNARYIWQGEKAAKVIERLKSFEGISQKIANMAARFLGTYYGERFNDWEKIDIPVDRHIARLFLRTGLVPAASGDKVQKITVLTNPIINKARALSPKFPGALDEPAFEVGKYWCTKEEAYCDYEGEPCPLSQICRRLTRYDVI
jgi:endonuclease III